MNERTKSAAKLIAFALIPLVISIIYAAMQGVMIWDINPLAVHLPQWCDEVYYYIQTNAMADGTMPLGYLGFNESTAPVGTLGAWSVFVLYPYVIIGRIFGMTPYMMIVCNIIFMVAAFAVFYILAKPDMEQMVKTVLIFAAVPLVARYTLSGMSEAMYFAGSIVLAGFTVRFIKGQYSRKSIFACYSVIVYLALCRPYLLAFALIPLYFHFKLKKMESIFAFGASVVIFGAIYVGFVRPRCAEYFFPIVDVSLFSILLRKGPAAFISRLTFLYEEGITAFKDFYRTDVWEVITPYNLLILLTAVIAVCTLANLIKNKKVQLDKTVAGALTVVIVVSIIVALLFLYVEYTGARHIIAIVVFLMMITAFYLPKCKNVFAIAVVAAVFLTGWYSVGKSDMVYKLSTDADEFGTIPVVQDAEKLENLFVPSEQADPWDNTVIFIYSDKNMNYCYCLPQYSGMNICEREWITDNIASVKSRYIMAENDEDEVSFAEAGWKVAIKADEYVIYERA